MQDARLRSHSSLARSGQLKTMHRASCITYATFCASGVQQACVEDWEQENGTTQVWYYYYEDVDAKRMVSGMICIRSKMIKFVTRV